MTPEALSELLGIITGSTTSTVDHLTKSGFVVRQPHPVDRRSILLDLTPGWRHVMMWVLDQYQRALDSAYAKHPQATPASLGLFLADLAAEFDKTVAKS